MLRSIKILVIAVTVALATPVALANWMSYGSFEPDVAEDADDGWMWDGVPEGDNQIYFNAYPTMSLGLTPLPSPNGNVGMLQTRFVNVDQSWKALLGVWKDCNEDGYIGLAESAVHSYRVELGLHNEDVCPVVPVENTHNDGVWIRELIPIGHDNPTNSLWGESAESLILDETAMVWGDAGYPGQDFGAGGGGNCWIRPQPRGTFSTTGGLNQAVDCYINHGDRYNAAIETVETESGLNTGLALADKDNWKQEGHPLNVVFLGDEHTDHSMAQVFDCSGNYLVDESVDDPTEPGETIDIQVRPVDVQPRGGNSIRATVNETLEGSTGDCDPSNDGGDWGLIEGDTVNAGTKGKTVSTFNFRFWSQPFSGVPNENADGAPHDYGLAALQPNSGTYWTSFTTTIGESPSVPARHGLVVNATNENPVTGPNPTLGAAPRYWTFYAYVNAAALGAGGLVLPGGGATGTYGFEWCGGATSGNHFGFNCDDDEWNRDGNGNPIVVPSGVKKNAAPGDLYNLRDIDCLDSGVQERYGACASGPLPVRPPSA